jgi:hypothetical protein
MPIDFNNPADLMKFLVTSSLLKDLGQTEAAHLTREQFSWIKDTVQAPELAKLLDSVEAAITDKGSVLKDIDQVHNVVSGLKILQTHISVFPKSKLNWVTRLFVTIFPKSEIANELNSETDNLTERTRLLVNYFEGKEQKMMSDTVSLQLSERKVRKEIDEEEAFILKLIENKDFQKASGSIIRKFFDAPEISVSGRLSDFQVKFKNLLEFHLEGEEIPDSRNVDAILAMIIASSEEVDYEALGAFKIFFTTECEIPFSNGEYSLWSSVHNAFDEIELRYQNSFENR